MNQRWQDGLSPFDGVCLITGEPLSVEELRELLGMVVSNLQSNYTGQLLYTFDDWHQHDGFVIERRPTNWPSFTAVFQSTQALIASRHGDSYVHRSFYPEDFSFLLRYDVPDEESGDGTGFSGAFDLSATSVVIETVLALVPAGLRARLRVESSKGYFDKTYSG